jgi:endo-1,3-1,4-beta-glycanase ExoK
MLRSEFSQSEPHVKRIAIMRLALLTMAVAIPSAVMLALSYPGRSEASGSRITGGEPFIDTMSALDTELWSVSDGWENGPYMVNDWQASQARFDNGLTLTLAPDVAKGQAYSSGEVQSRAEYGHGYFETTMRAAPGSGVITGFFTYTGPPFGQNWNEIDVEVIGAKPREVLLTYFFGDDKISKAVPLGFDATAEYHTYGFDWQPDSIEWYVDGRSIHKVTGTDLPIPNLAKKLMASLWGSETLTEWSGPFDKSAMPTSAKFTCIAHSRSAADGMPCTELKSK